MSRAAPCRALTAPRTLTRSGAILALAAVGLGPAAAPLLAAQDPDTAAVAGERALTPCAFERCGLRLQGRAVFRGPGDDRVARLGLLYADLGWLETAGDSAAAYARAAARDHEAGAFAGALGAIAFLPFYPSYGPGWDIDPPDDALWTYVGLAATGVVLTIIGRRRTERVGGALSRATWWYNRDVAAGGIPDPGAEARPELPPLDPSHFGRAGLVWGAAAGMTAGSLLVYHEGADDAALLELVALPAAGAGLGWLVGRAIRR